MKNKFLKLTIFTSLLSILITPLFTSNSMAQTTNNDIKSVLSVSPVIINSELKRGNESSYSIKVTNKLSEPLGIRASIEDFTAADEESALDPGTHSPILDISTLSKDNFIMNPGESKTFDLNIKTPSNFKDGGYYEIVFLTPFYTRALNTNSPTVLSKIGILVIANLGKVNFTNLQSKVKILDLTSNNQTKNMIVNFRVENDYFTHFTAKPFITLTSLFGASERIQLSEKTVLPGKIRRWGEQINPQNKSLFYKVNLAVSVGEGNYVYKDTYFLLLPIRQILILGIALLIAVIILIRRKQIQKAFKVLIKG